MHGLTPAFFVMSRRNMRVLKDDSAGPPVINYSYGWMLDWTDVPGMKVFPGIYG